MQNYSGMCVLWSHTSAVLLNHEYFSESESVSRSVVSDSATPWTAAHQAPLSMEFSRQEYWSGLPFPSPGDFPNTGVKSGSLALQVDFLLSKPHQGIQIVNVEEI